MKVVFDSTMSPGSSLRRLAWETTIGSLKIGVCITSYSSFVELVIMLTGVEG